MVCKTTRGLITLCAITTITFELAGCIRVATINISQKTSLERQLMGDLEPLSEEEILASSIRAAPGVDQSTTTQIQQLALDARRRQLFNRDDIDELTQAGCIGMKNDAILVMQPCDATHAPEVHARLVSVLEQENHDRNVIIDWVIATDPALTPADRPRIAELYATLQRQK